MQQFENDDDRSGSLSGRLADARSDFAGELEQRSYLGKLWSEICELPERQRAALLLNLKDSQGGGGILLFQLTGVASIRKIAQALSIAPAELATLWGDLPLDDLTIANRWAGLASRSSTSASPRANDLQKNERLPMSF
jgi:hypothetical protein